MTPVGRPHSYRWLIAALLLVCGIFTPRTSGAACGHYATKSAGAGHATTADLVRLTSDWLAPTSAEGREPTPKPPTSPCGGLGCSRNPSTPFPPAAAPRIMRLVELWGCLELAEFAARPSSALTTRDLACVLPARRVDRLDRPPR